MEASEKYREILRLDRMLNDAGIPHELKMNLDGWQIGYPVLRPGKRVVSVVENLFSYGHELDKLEIMGLLTKEEKKWDGVAGGLDAQNVFKRIKKHWEGAENG